MFSSFAASELSAIRASARELQAKHSPRTLAALCQEELSKHTPPQRPQDARICSRFQLPFPSVSRRCPVSGTDSCSLWCRKCALNSAPMTARTQGPFGGISMHSRNWPPGMPAEERARRAALMTNFMDAVGESSDSDHGRGFSALPWFIEQDLLFWPDQSRPDVLSVPNQFTRSGTPLVIMDGSTPVWDSTPFVAIHVDSDGVSSMLLTCWNSWDLHMLSPGDTGADLRRKLPVLTRELCMMDRSLVYDLHEAGRIGGVLGRRSFLTCDTRDAFFAQQGLGGGIPGLNVQPQPRTEPLQFPNYLPDSLRPKPASSGYASGKGSSTSTAHFWSKEYRRRDRGSGTKGSSGKSSSSTGKSSLTPKRSAPTEQTPGKRAKPGQTR